MRSLRYDLKLMYPPGELAALLALWGLILLAYADRLFGKPPEVQVLGVLAILEASLPLLALFAVAHAVSLEWEEGSVELSMSYPLGGLGLLARRLGVGLLLCALVEAVTLGLCRWLLPLMAQPGPGNALRVAWVIAPPALFVAALGLLGSVVGKHHVAGLGAGLLVWGLDLVRPGLLTGQLYLYQASRPLPSLSLGPNRLGLTLAAIAGFALAAVLWSRRERALR